ncbi:SagB family peptide dehydrogenase [Streptomyces sp. NPDC093595]|uniref:SagB family peptide dehydrogenase n=1 Tax=Streptomyces sp. NPDC093595 TaxID=3366045 RepID=UPI00380930EF
MTASLNELRTSACGVLSVQQGKLIWDDYLGHRQSALSDGVEQLLRWFATWRPIDSVRNLDPARGENLLGVAHALWRRNILVARGSARQRREEEFGKRWSQWGHLTQAFHLATRTHSDTPYIPLNVDLERLQEKQVVTPPPPPFLTRSNTNSVSLPKPRDQWQSRDFIDILYRRRSRRQFGDSPLDLQRLATLLYVAGAPKPHVNGELSDSGQNVFKTSPSGGARHPTELYVYVRKVDGLEPGIYHYAANKNTLEPIGRKWTDDLLVSACGDQLWISKASALIIYTAVIARTQWKYPMGRVYRALLLDVGHLSQTVYLLATALGIPITFTAALRDQMVEELLDCDPAREIIIGTSVLGTKPTNLD